MVVLALSLLAPAVVGVDKAIQLSRQRKASVTASAEITAGAKIKAEPGIGADAGESGLDSDRRHGHGGPSQRHGKACRGGPALVRALTG